MVVTDKKPTRELRQERYVTAKSPKEFIKFVLNYYNSGGRKAICLLGDIGVGKSESMREIAKRIAHSKNMEYWEYDQSKPKPENAFTFVDLRLTDLEPSDLTGIPRDDPSDPNYAIMKLQKFARHLKDGAGMLFLDEITNEQRPNMKASSYRVLLDRLLGFIRMHPDVIVVAAGNFPDDAVGIAEPMAAPQASRVLFVEMKAPSVKEWIDYMHNNVYEERPVIGEDGKPVIDVKTGRLKVEKVPSWDMRVAAFLQSNEPLFLNKPKESALLENFPTPRSWTDLARVAHKLVDIEDLKTAAEGMVGKEAAMNFIQFISTKIEPLEVYANDLSKWDALKSHSEEIAARYLICAQIADRWAMDEKLDNLCLHILKKNQDYMGMIFAMQQQKAKNTVVQRFIKKDKTILNFVKDMTFWTYNTQDVDGSAIYGR